MSGAGFTGTQRGMTEAQWATLYNLLRERIGYGREWHEGDCIGADAQSVTLARLFRFRVICHPPTNSSKRAFVPADEYREPLPYLDRNKAIVCESREMFATPGEATEQLRSGTWSTIRYARSKGRPLYVILPDGRVTK